MSTTEIPAHAQPESPRSGPRLAHGERVRVGTIAIGLLVVIILVPAIFSLYYVDADRKSVV